jgi:hypothetical protein
MKSIARWAAEPLPGSGIVQNITHAILVDPDGTPSRSRTLSPRRSGPLNQVRHRHQRTGTQTTQLTTNNHGN